MAPCTPQPTPCHRLEPVEQWSDAVHEEDHELSWLTALREASALDQQRQRGLGTNRGIVARPEFRAECACCRRSGVVDQRAADEMLKKVWAAREKIETTEKDHEIRNRKSMVAAKMIVDIRNMKYKPIKFCPS